MPGMRIRRRSLLIPLCAWPLAAMAQDDLGAPEPEVDVERPPRYRVELIVFANNELDPAEEYLALPPPLSQFNPRRVPPVRRYVDAAMLRSIERQVEAPIMIEPAESAPAPRPADVLAIDFFLPEPANLGLRILDPSELMLNDAFATLERLGAYTPLLHAGWEQNGLSEEAAVAIDVARFGSLNPTGTIRLHVSRFLHARVDLAYRPPLQLQQTVPAFGDNGSVLYGDGLSASRLSIAPTYYLFEERRLFRGELNYLDHPAFGVILIVTLAPEPEPELTAPGVTPSA